MILVNWFTFLTIAAFLASGFHFMCPRNGISERAGAVLPALFLL
jgi:hypothetical protein